MASGLVGLVLTATLGAACSAEAETRSEEGRRQVEQAVTHARDARSFRVSGELRMAGTAVVEWHGAVNGSDEMYEIRTHGLVVESRRLDGSSWARRVDSEDVWHEVPYDAPLDLAVLSRGVVEGVEHDGSWRVTLTYQAVDVLYALTHIPSTGPSTARVTVDDDEMDIELQLAGHAEATVHFTDFGTAVHVVPPPAGGSSDEVGNVGASVTEADHS